jgi:hypothetical protein
MRPPPSLLCRASLRAGSLWFSFRCAFVLAHRFAAQLDPVGARHNPVDGCIGDARIADQIVPSLDRKLAGQNRRPSSMTILDYFEKVPPLTVVQRHQPPIIHGENVCLSEPGEQAIEVAIDVGDGQFPEELRSTEVMDRVAFPAGLLQERTTEIGLSDSGRACDILLPLATSFLFTLREEFFIDSSSLSIGQVTSASWPRTSAFALGDFGL